jgi:hypothetical protein
LLVAIAVVGGKPTIEALKIIGYDARATDIIQNQNNLPFGAASGGDLDTLKEAGENVAVYIKNDSVQSVTLNELRFGGSIYTFANPAPASLDVLANGFYTLAGAAGGTGTELITSSSAAVIQPGQTTSIVVSLSEDMKTGRDTQFKLTTTNGAVFVGTVVIGQQSG